MPDCPITNIEASALAIPTDGPESDGTSTWSSTTIVIVRITAAGLTGLGYSYTDRSVAALITERFWSILMGQDAMGISALWNRMQAESRSMGVTGLISMAISAVDNALWDLKARLLSLPLVTLIGDVRERIPIYASGGSTSYDRKAMQAQLDGWIDKGIDQLKIRIGRDHDSERVQDARSSIGAGIRLFVDANGAYTVKQALKMARILDQADVSWFEEPVPSWDADGLSEIRRGAPESMDISSGGYAWCVQDSKRLIDAQAVDVLQADATRCLGISGLIDIDTLCRTQRVPLSTHCAPAQHLHPSCALPSIRHMEYFHDHVRIERLIFDGLPEVANGRMRPDRSAPGNGLTYKQADAEKYRI